ncbi:MAG: HU family DNA-binding protein [Patescibacteria group bacterium]|jgi:DNA-binding protein HU-beta
MNKEELINQLAQRMNADQKTAQNFVESFISLIQDSISKGDSVFIPELGTFEPKVNK